MNERILILLRKLIDGQLQDERDKEELYEWALQSPHHFALFEYFRDSEAFLDEIKKLLRDESRTSYDHSGKVF